MNDTAALCAFLLRNINAIRYDEAAAQIHDELIWLHKAAERAVDRSPSRVYAGPCHAPLAGVQRCQRPLYAWPSKAKDAAIVCDGWRPLGGSDYDVGCRAQFTFESRKEWLIDEVEEALVPLDELRAALPHLFPLLALPPGSTWRAWVSLGRLNPRTIDRAGNELFRGGDALDLLRAYRPHVFAPRRGRVAS